MEVFFLIYDMNVGYFFLDITPPKIQCPENIVVGTDSDEDYAAVNWTVPIATGKLEIEKKTMIDAVLCLNSIAY